MVHERRKSVKLKSLFRNDSTEMNRKPVSQLKISSPVLQHSTSVYFMVSPINTSFHVNERHTPSPLSTASSLTSSPLTASPLSRRKPEKVEREMTVDGTCVNAQTVTRSRRHSCSSTGMYDEKILSQPQPPKSAFANKTRNRYGSSNTKNGSSNAAASVVTIEPSFSKSTPLQHKVKTYNVGKKGTSEEELEKQRKAKELEDLITSRRGSTLKLTLTPKGL